MNILSLLKEDHQKIKGLLGGLKNSKKSNGKFEELHKLVHAHSKAEEASFYELLKTKKSARPIALEGYEEHQVASNLLKELDQLGPDDETWRAKLTVLDEVLHHHIKEEEAEMFSDAKKACTPEELVEAGESFKERKGALTEEFSIEPRAVHSLEKRRSNKMGKLEKIKEMKNQLSSNSGKIGYLVAWLLGIPVSVLFFVYLIRGH